MFLTYFANLCTLLDAAGFMFGQGRGQEFCSGGANHWRRQISNFCYFAQRSFWCHWSNSGLLQQDMTSSIFCQPASMKFNKDKKTFAFAVIIIKQLLTKQFSMNTKSSGKKSVVQCCPREYRWLCLFNKSKSNKSM